MRGSSPGSMYTLVQHYQAIADFTAADTASHILYNIDRSPSPCGTTTLPTDSRCLQSPSSLPAQTHLTERCKSIKA